MVNYRRSLDATFSALGDATRRAILARLSASECSVGELAQPFEMSLPAISKHLRVLENARLITRVREGRLHRCRLNLEPLESASDWIARHRDFWQHQLQSLENYLTTQEKEEKAWRPHNRHRRASSGSRAASRSRARKSGGRGPKRKR